MFWKFTKTLINTDYNTSTYCIWCYSGCFEDVYEEGRINLGNRKTFKMNSRPTIIRRQHSLIVEQALIKNLIYAKCCKGHLHALKAHIYACILEYVWKYIWEWMFKVKKRWSMVGMREKDLRQRERDNKCKVITKVIEKYFYFPCTFWLGV